ncbi:hypothetical protein LTR36_001399 [Oleoguttula mirabilis]|uniref:WD40 repeat-like protein n=1 Tax=Oleoguttula mirabilis TaxID=1507867 RepID=A0AAV9JP83_9PEZI|nr:hypothetical protein LTR36_001399 [Oleoguttula mirabilis]
MPPIPAGKHVLITTPSRVYAWDDALHVIFESSKGGIVAATEVDNGVLAVASKHIVVLHDTKRAQERSWGLNNGDYNDDEIRHLAYTQRCLFLTTTLTNGIQRYSVERATLLSPAQTHHHSPPVAFAVSPTGQLMVSASDNPPTVYIKSLEHNEEHNDNTSILIEPRASETAVCVVAFHPERANIFLLGFEDGTLAAYDGEMANRKVPKDALVNPETGNDGEIARFTNLHRTTATGGISSRAASITGAAFLHGSTSRAVSVGNDGRCRLVDCDGDGTILRTWHAKAPLTSISVLAPAENGSSPRQKVGHEPPYSLPVLAIGRADGKIRLYDSLGIFVAQKTVSEAGEKIISVEWVDGPSPRPNGGVRATVLPSSIPNLAISRAGGKGSRIPNVAGSKSGGRRSSMPGGLGLPPALRRRPDASDKRKPSARADRRFTIHPDEAQEGTVRYTPSSPQRGGSVVPLDRSHDLFSPATSRRARISSRTFQIAATTPARGAPTRQVLSSARQGLAKQRAWHPGNVLEREATWPTDSVQDENVWHTEGRYDGSTEDDDTRCRPSRHSTAQSEVFTPSSVHVRELFPRTSSMSPHRKRTRKPPKHERALQQVTGNTLARQAKETKAAAGGQTQDPRCFDCAATAARVTTLEDEVGRLRGEVLAMKAALRRSGVPLPPSAGVAR